MIALAFPFISIRLRTGSRIAKRICACSKCQSNHGMPLQLPNYLPSFPIRFLVIGDAPDLRQALQALLTSPGFVGEACTDANEALLQLSTNTFDVVICDLDLPGMGNSGLLEIIRRRFSDIAVVVITNEDDPAQALRAAHAGALDYLVRPLRGGVLLVRIYRAATLQAERKTAKHRSSFDNEILRRMEELQERLQRIECTSEQTLGVLGYALGLRDNETANHCERVKRYSLELARAVRCSSGEINTITQGAYLHDIGKIGIPDAILHKPGPLTPEERTVMEKHVTIGYEMVRRISFLIPAAKIVLSHHERFDGTGYPQRLAADQIPLGARIFSVVDALDAITSCRPYRAAQPYSVARDEIMRESGRQFDPEVVRAFLSLPLELWQEIRELVEEQRPVPNTHELNDAG